MNPFDQPADSHRPAVASTVDLVSRHVTDLALVGPKEPPAWLAALAVPPGWQIGRAQNSPVQPTRTAVHGRDPRLGWHACETINVFCFKGVPPHGVIRFNADCTLRTGGAQDITIHHLQVPAEATMTATRSSGDLTLVDQRRIWAQCSTYIAGDDTEGLLVEHGIFAISGHQTGLHDDITKLSNAIHDALVSTMAAAPEQSVQAAGFPAVGDLSLTEGTEMAIFRVGYFSDFDWGDDVVLVGADRDGMRMFQSAVRSAHVDGAASFEFDAIKHYVVRQNGAADIELGSQTTVWRFDDAKLVEMLNLIEPLVDGHRPGHQYVDDLTLLRKHSSCRSTNIHAVAHSRRFLTGSRCPTRKIRWGQQRGRDSNIASCLLG